MPEKFRRDNNEIRLIFSGVRATSLDRREGREEESKGQCDKAR